MLCRGLLSGRRGPKEGPQASPGLGGDLASTRVAKSEARAELVDGARKFTDGKKTKANDNVELAVAA